MMMVSYSSFCLPSLIFFFHWTLAAGILSSGWFHSYTFQQPSIHEWWPTALNRTLSPRFKIPNCLPDISTSASQSFLTCPNLAHSLLLNTNAVRWRDGSKVNSNYWFAEDLTLVPSTLNKWLTVASNSRASHTFDLPRCHTHMHISIQTHTLYS